MNKVTIMSLVLVFVACNINHDKQEMSVDKTEYIGNRYDKKASIDTGKSYIKWRGTKLIGSAHEGTVKFKSGHLGFSKDTLAGGSFIADMKTINNTDIPLSDPIPRELLTTHLNEDFETGKYPEAVFNITHAKTLQSNKFIITGDLTIKGLTHPISLEVKENEDGYSAQFLIDRFDWNVGKSGTWLEKKLVDAEIELDVYVVLL